MKLKDFMKTPSLESLQKKGVIGFLFGIIESSKSRLRWWLYNSVDILKTTELYSLNG